MLYNRTYNIVIGVWWLRLCFDLCNLHHATANSRIKMVCVCRVGL